METKMGRPTEEPKNTTVRARFSDEEVRILNVCCEKTGLSRSEIIRNGIKKIYDELVWDQFNLRW